MHAIKAHLPLSPFTVRCHFLSLIQRLACTHAWTSTKSLANLACSNPVRMSFAAARLGVRTMHPFTATYKLSALRASAARARTIMVCNSIVLSHQRYPRIQCHKIMHGSNVASVTPLKDYF